jgi:hypothetical protein
MTSVQQRLEENGLGFGSCRSLDRLCSEPSRQICLMIFKRQWLHSPGDRDIFFNLASSVQVCVHPFRDRVMGGRVLLTTGCAIDTSASNVKVGGSGASGAALRVFWSRCAERQGGERCKSAQRDEG